MTKLALAAVVPDTCLAGNVKYTMCLLQNQTRAEKRVNIVFVHVRWRVNIHMSIVHVVLCLPDLQVGKCLVTC